MNGGVSRTRFVSRSRQPGLTEAERRRLWVLFIGLAKDRARQALALQPIAEADARDFAGLVVRLKSGDFPVAYASAQTAAESVLIAARGLNAAARAEDRALLGELLLAGAHVLDGLLARSAIEISERWRRQLGEAEE